MLLNLIFVSPSHAQKSSTDAFNLEPKYTRQKSQTRFFSNTNNKNGSNSGNRNKDDMPKYSKLNSVEYSKQIYKIIDENL